MVGVYMSGGPTMHFTGLIHDLLLPIQLYLDNRSLWAKHLGLEGET